MNTADTLAAVCAGCMVLGMMGSILALIFRIGNLNGTVRTFMSIADRDRLDIVRDIARLEERHERHIEQHKAVRP